MSSGKMTIDLKVNNLEKEVAKVKKMLKGAGDEAEKSIGKKGEKGVNRITKAFGKLKNVIAAVFVTGAIAAFGKKLLGLGSDMEETASKFDNVFGEAADDFSKELDVMGQAIGRSKLELMEYTSSIGNLLQPLGFAKEASAALAKEITKVAIDQASFTNKSDAQAVNAMTKALLGEREALKGIDIAINQAQVNQKALEIAQRTGIDATTEAARALATYEILVEKTKNAQGDAVRTAGSFANQLKRVQGIIKDTYANAGREVANESASVLEEIGNFIQKYGAAIMAGLIEIGRAIGDFFTTIGEVMGEIFNEIGQALGLGGEQIYTFGDIVMIVVNGIGIAIRIMGRLLKGAVSLTVAAIKDIALTWDNGFNYIASSLALFGSTVSGAFQALGNNMVVGIAKGINKAVDIMNKAIRSFNNVAGTSFGEVSRVAEGQYKSIADYTKDMNALVEKDGLKLVDDFGKNMSAARQEFGDGIYDVTEASVDSVLSANSKIKRSNDDLVSLYDTNYASIEDIIGSAGIAGANAGKKAAKGAGKGADAAEERKDEMEELEDVYERFTDDLKDSEKLTEDISKAYKKMTKTIKDGLSDVTEELGNLRNEYEDTIASIDEELGSDLQDNLQSFIRSQTESEADLVERLQESDLDSSERIESEKELEQIRKNIADSAGEEYQRLVESERARAALSDQEREMYDFREEQDERSADASFEKSQAEEKYTIEKERLERQQRIFEVFQGMQAESVKDLQKLLEDERIQQLSREEQQLIEKLVGERIEYQQLVDDKERMERRLAATQKYLSDQVTIYMKQNVQSLSSDYSRLISQINAATRAQRALNAAKAAQRYKGGDVSAGSPYWVGENPDGSFNRTTELFIPRERGTIVNAQKVQDAIRQVMNVDRSKSVHIDNVNYPSPEKAADMIDRIRFRL